MKNLVYLYVNHPAGHTMSTVPSGPDPAGCQVLCLGTGGPGPAAGTVRPYIRIDIWYKINDINYRDHGPLHHHHHTLEVRDF